MNIDQFAEIGKFVVMSAALDRDLGGLVAALLEVPEAPAVMIFDAVDISRKLALLSAMRAGHFKTLRGQLKTIEDHTRSLVDARNTVVHGSVRFEDGRWIAKATSPNKALRFDPKDHVLIDDIPILTVRTIKLCQEIQALKQMVLLRKAEPSPSET